MPQSNAEVINSLETQRDAILAELAAITAKLLDLVNNPKVTYTVSGDHGSQTFDHNTYNKWLLDAEKACLEKLERITTLQQMFQPYSFTRRMV